MRSIKLSNGLALDVRGLTRREVRKFREQGIDFGRLELDQADDALDRVLTLVLAADVRELLEDLPYNDSLRAWRAALAETFGAPDEEKNLPSAGGGPATASA